MEVTRTFHPVGQGAFYSEVFREDGDVRFVAVYDCGTETSSRAMNPNLDNQIESFKKDIAKIDLLFISHFHKDHVSGLDKLLNEIEVGRTVVPMLDEATILVTRAYNHLIYGEEAAENIDNIIQEIYYVTSGSKRFGTIIYVRPMSEKPLRNNVWLPKSPGGDTIDSGEIISDNLLWEYIPFNSIELNDERAITFQDSLSKNYGNSIPDLSSLILNHRNEVQKLYKNAIGSANENLYSLVVVSRPVEGLHPQPDSRLSSGIYFGDFDYHQASNPWERIKECADYQTIGTVQVPHHGSKRNWNPEMGDGEPRQYVISSGSTNSYHHPNYWVVEDICKRGHQCFVVSEKTTKEDTFVL